MIDSARAAAKKLAKEQARSNKTAPDGRLPPGHVWVYDKILGEGGQGVAHLWNQVDETGGIVDRVVIKNFQLRPWSDVIFTGPGKGQIREAYIQQKLVCSETEPQDQFTVATLAVQPVPGIKAGWRTYAPFYSLGNLAQLTNSQPATRAFPEPFIWYTFWRLAKGVVAMDEKLRVDGKTEPVVVHNDLKPENVFMNHPGSLGKDADYIMYPSAYIGDFGLAYLTSEDRPKRYGGTPGFIVPENEFDEDDDPVFDTDCHSKSNVWAIAYNILLAMEGTTERLRPPATDYIEYDTERDTELGPDWPGYSKELIRTVESCLDPVMDERPSPQDLLATIETHMAQLDGGMKRWGTLSWVTELHNKLENEKHTAAADDDGETHDPPPLTRSKRKSTGPLPPAKRRKESGNTLDTRLHLIAYQMLYGASTKVNRAPFLNHPDFVLPAPLRVKYSTTYFPPIIRPDVFFLTPEPEATKHRILPRVFVDWLQGLSVEEESEVILLRDKRRLFEEGEVIEGEPPRKKTKGSGLLGYRIKKDTTGGKEG